MGSIPCGTVPAFVIIADLPVFAGVFAFLAAAAVVNIVVVTRRKLCGEPG